MAMNPTSPGMQKAMETLQKAGINSTYGRWLVEGSPRVLLIDVKAGFQFFEEWREDFLGQTGVLLPEEDDMSSDALVFGYLVTWFLAEVRQIRKRVRRVIRSDSFDRSSSVLRQRMQSLPISTSGRAVSQHFWPGRGSWI